MILLLPLRTFYNNFAKVQPVVGVQLTCLNSSYKEADKANFLAFPLGWC